MQELDKIAKKFVDYARCSKCGKSEDEHGMFSDHDYEEMEEVPEDEEEGKSITITFNEAVSIGGDLSAQSVGGKKIEECEPCSMFNKTHKALMQETGLTESHEGDLDRILEAKDSDVEWITVNGAHIPIKKGQTKGDAVNDFFMSEDIKGRPKTKSISKLVNQLSHHPGHGLHGPEREHYIKATNKIFAKHVKAGDFGPQTEWIGQEIASDGSNSPIGMASSWSNSPAGQVRMEQFRKSDNDWHSLHRDQGEEERNVGKYERMFQKLADLGLIEPDPYDKKEDAAHTNWKIKGTGKLDKRLRAERDAKGEGPKGGPYKETVSSKAAFDKVHEALMKETHNPMDIPVGHEVDEGGPGSGIKGHTTAKDQSSDMAPEQSQALDRYVAQFGGEDSNAIFSLGGWDKDMHLPPEILSQVQGVDDQTILNYIQNKMSPGTFDPMNEPVPTNNAGEENPFLADVKRKAKGQLHGLSDKGPGAKSGVSQEGGPGSGIKGHTTAKDDDIAPAPANLGPATDMIYGMLNDPNTDRPGIESYLVSQGISPEDAAAAYDHVERNFDWKAMPKPAVEPSSSRGGAKSNPSMENFAQIDKIYTDMENQIDPDKTGDLSSGYGQSIIDDTSAKYGISPEQGQEIWDSGGTTDIDVLTPEQPQEVPDDERGYQAPDDPEAIELHRLEDQERKDHADES